MSAIPPKQTPDTPEDETPGTGGGLVAMYNAASHANAESFPVLKAFQDYLEAERAQARKRVMLLSIFFAVLMGVVVTGFLSAGLFMVRNMSAVQNKLLDVALAAKTAPQQPAPVPAPVVQTSPALEESVRQMSRATSELQASLDKKLDGVSEITAKVHEKVASQDGELEKLRAEVRHMQEQSDSLKNEWGAIRETAKKAESAAVTPAPQPPPPVAPAPKVAPAQKVTTVAHVPAPPTPVPAPAPTVSAPVITAAPHVAVAPSALAAVAAAPATGPQKPPVAPAPPPVPLNDPRFPPAVKDPPVTPSGVTPPAPPQGMMATAVPLKTKNTGTIPWRVLIPE